jgi:hypothetical protein
MFCPPTHRPKPPRAGAALSRIRCNLAWPVKSRFRLHANTSATYIAGESVIGQRGDRSVNGRRFD